MTGSPHASDSGQRRKVRKSAFFLAAVAFLFYAGFIAVGVLNS